MADRHPILVARVTARPGQEDVVQAALLRLVANTRQEAGCLRYDLHRSVGDPAVFVFYEIWESEGALDAHRASAFMADHKARIAPALAGTVVEPLDLLSA